MPLKTRRILFYGLVVLFIIAGTGIVFYSRGWRAVIENCEIAKPLDCSVKFKKTGAIYVETEPKEVVIKINNKIFKDKSGLIQKGTLIGGLPPKTYKVEVEKNGYLPWLKNLKVESSLVAEGIKIILIPEKIKKTPVSTGQPVKNFWFSNRDNFIYKNGENLYYSSFGAAQDKQNSPLSKLRGNEFIVWSQDGEKIISKNTLTKTYYFYNTGDLKKAVNINLTLNNLDKKFTIKKIAFHPAESNRLIVEDKNKLSILDLGRLKLENIIPEPILAWYIENPNIYYIKITQTYSSDAHNPKLITHYYLASFNLIIKTETVMAELPPNLKTVSEISASGGNVAITNENKNLYIFNQETKIFKKIADSAEKLFFSPDNRKIALFDKNGFINIYFLKDYDVSIHKKAGDTIKLSAYGGLEIKNIYWHENSHHLLVDYFDNKGIRKLDFIEIDDRQPTNKYTIAEKISDFYYNKDSNKIYISQKDSLYFIEI